MLAQRAFEAERQRQLPSETVIAAILGEGCGSTAWCYSLRVNHNRPVGLYADVAQREFFGSGPDVLASSAFDPWPGRSPRGRRLHPARTVAVLERRLLGGATPDQGPGLFLVPRACYHVVDTWVRLRARGHGEQGCGHRRARVRAGDALRLLRRCRRLLVRDHLEAAISGEASRARRSRSRSAPGTGGTCASPPG